MSFEIVESFTVLALNDVPMKTSVEHSLHGDRDVVRIEQAPCQDGDAPDVVLLNRSDFERISAIMKGH
jgi:hypothetical protein